MTILSRSGRSVAAAQQSVVNVQWIMAVFVSLALMAASVAHAAAPESFADLSEKLLPAVVNISTTQTLKNSERGMEMPQFPPGSPFDELFKDFLERHGGGNGQEARPQKVTSLGSGFIIDPSGLVVTNNHVIADADEITVTLQDGQAFKAEVVGTDTKGDVSLLRIKAPKPLPAVSFGNSDGMRVGDWVLAIGNPLGLGGTVTAGIVSARSRNINAGPYDDFIQTDAAINKGNSGGPLFNTKGEVIGINTAIYSQSGGSIGIGFAIPANQAQKVVLDLQKYGKTRRAWLGVHIQSVTDEIAESLGLKDHNGALVADVTPNGPAAKAGLKSGDVILKFDGKEVNEFARLPRIVSETAINKEVEVDLLRDGKKMAVKVAVAELPDDKDLEQAQAEKPAGKQKDGTSSNVSGLGFSVTAVTPALKEKYDLPSDAKGLVVTDVKPSSAAAERGLRPGDVILEAAQEPVKSLADLNGKIDAAKKADRKSVLLLVQSDGALRFLPLKVDDANKDKDSKDKDKKSK
ncbi:MAG TPA: DegQ family serine endoprotease [Magnetospirillaceae bacterium]|nr:DegQ family serine endoprotease [Magnetospirillaceae bacterium]